MLYKNMGTNCNIENPKIPAGFLADFPMLHLIRGNLPILSNLKLKHYYQAPCAGRRLFL